MKCQKALSCVIALIGLAFIAPAQAALLSRLDGLAYYDDVLDITWLTDANFAVSNNFGVSGIGAGGTMDWVTAQQWLLAMNTVDGTGYLGFNDWRMPETGPVNGVSYNLDTGTFYDGSRDVGYNTGAPGTAYAGSTDSEMAHLFYTTLGNLANYDIAGNAGQPGWGLSNPGPFSNLVTHPYWSATDISATSDAWNFDFATGYQRASYTGNPYYVWAVRSGDVSAVPVPAAFWLFSSGLLFMIRLRRK